MFKKSVTEHHLISAFFILDAVSPMHAVSSFKTVAHFTPLRSARLEHVIQFGMGIQHNFVTIAIPELEGYSTLT